MITCIHMYMYSGIAFTGAGYANTGIVPMLKRVGKKEGVAS